MSKRLNTKTLEFYKILLKYLKVEHTVSQCAQHFGLTDHHMRYHIDQLSKSECIAFSGNYHGAAKMHITVKNEYVHVPTEPVEYKDKTVQRVVQLSPFITQYNLMTNVHPHREQKKSARNYVSGSSLSVAV